VLGIKEQYEKKVVPQLMQQFGITNRMHVPRVVKIVVNAGVGDVTVSPNALENMRTNIATITGQRPVLTKAKKSIASFKIREGMPIGVCATLRGERMYAFLERLVHIALPRVRDFRGISPTGFDGRGNYSLGIKEQVVFPEINFDDIERVRSLQVTIVTTARHNEEAYTLLKLLGMPFKED
jgi:large subunit ribosomal protein L5